eukprot:COSAG05_NODE_574_length_8600_cov_2.783790_2_plen_72_part_00
MRTVAKGMFWSGYDRGRINTRLDSEQFVTLASVTNRWPRFRNARVRLQEPSECREAAAENLLGEVIFVCIS